MAKDQFKDHWVKGNKIGKGGQALTYHATKIADDGQKYALKILKAQGEIDRRERMFVEVSALRTLRHEQIPKYIDSNADQFSDLSLNLFLVTEFIPGPTLEEYISHNGPLKLPEAIKLTISLAEILEHCHLKGFYHRDIKPDNIILCEGAFDQPYLIDFGLSFNEELPKAETPSWEHIGNRFLALPELRVREGNKKDRRSDITMLWAVLLYTLTAIHPTDLLDEHNVKPHRRERSKQIIDGLDANTRGALNNAFDIAFNFPINVRWQSIESTKLALTDLKQIKPYDMDDNSDISKKLSNFKKRMEEAQDYKQFGLLKEIFESCHEILSEANELVRKELPNEVYGRFQSSYAVDFKHQSYTNVLGLKHYYNDALNFHPTFNCYATGSELVLEAKENGQRAELMRTPLSEEINWRIVRDNIIQYYISGVLSKDVQ